ncbi:glycosyltransferase family 25 protein [Falsigemmobacter intermedius]|uniref:glycosyltransferase family 25 protein n=1 Tax=Falsigemmobacter intermedius TaxID=1553448 RepID=UPI003F04FA52
MSKDLTRLAAWYINLDRSTDRRDAMEAQLAALNLPFGVTRFSGVDGRADASLAGRFVDAPAFRRQMGREILPGEIGVFLSHLRVWEAFLASDAEVALVMEDDVVFHDDFKSALEVALSQQPRWDMLKLNKIRAKVPVTQFRAEGYDFNLYLGPATGFGAYLITRDLAQKLVGRVLPIRLPVDYEATRWWAHDFRLLGLEPFPSHVDDGGVSTINGRNFEAVKKPPKQKRWRNYAMRGGNYGRRLAMMLKLKLLKRI